MDEKQLKELEKQLETLGKSIDSKLDDFNKKAKEATVEDMKTLKADIKLQVETEIKKYNELNEKLQKQVDALDTKLQRVNTEPGMDKITFSKAVKVELDKFKDAKGSIREKIREKRGSGELSLKGIEDLLSKVDDMTTANTLTSVLVPMRVPGIQYDPDAAFRIRTLLPQGTTSAGSVTFAYESAISTNTDITAEAQEFMQEDVDLAITTATVRKITNYIIASEELLDDLEGFMSYISARLPSKLKVKEDVQLLRGSGAGINISGIITNATAYSDNLADSTITRVDVLVDALRQVKDDEYTPTAILLHPADAVKLKLSKTSTGDYTMPWIYQSGQISLDGVPVYESTAMTAGTFLVGDFRRGAQVFDRKEASLEIAYQNEDNFVKGMVTIRVSERLALAVYRAKCFVYGNFAAALAQGSA
jgi:HK97 family phage major capsid protein